MSKQANDVVNAIGAMAEMCDVLYKQLIVRGFKHKDAMELVKEYINATVAPRGK